MTKKDYIRLAQAIKENSGHWIGAEPQIWASMQTITKAPFLDALCDILAVDNPKFDKVKFMEACNDYTWRRHPHSKAMA